MPALPADAGVPQRYVQRVRSAFAKQRQLFEQALPEWAEVGARVDGDAQRDVRRKQSPALGTEAFEPFMPQGDREPTLAADPWSRIGNQIRSHWFTSVVCMILPVCGEPVTGTMPLNP